MVADHDIAGAAEGDPQAPTAGDANAVFNTGGEWAGARALVVCGGPQHVAWGRGLQATLSEAAPGAHIGLWTVADNPSSIAEAASQAEAVFAWEPPPGLWAACGPSLRFISSLGIGTDHLHGGGPLPDRVPVAKLVDPLALTRMAHFCLHAVLSIALGSHSFLAQQRAGGWEPGAADVRCDPGQVAVGVMGLGPMGMAIAAMLQKNGFRVIGWSRRPRSCGEVDFATYAGLGAVPEFLEQLQVLVVILPATPETTGLLDAARLSHLPRGGALVNVGRGQVVVEGDLLGLLDSGHLSHATLDVTAPEPPNSDSPLWAHPRVTLTPHIAGRIGHDTACRALLDNWARARSGLPLEYQVRL